MIKKAKSIYDYNQKENEAAEDEENTEDTNDSKSSKKKIISPSPTKTKKDIEYEYRWNNGDPKMPHAVTRNKYFADKARAEGKKVSAVPVKK